MKRIAIRLAFVTASLLALECLHGAPASGDTACRTTVTGTIAKNYEVPPPSQNDNAEIQCAIDAAVKDLQNGAAQSATVSLQPNVAYHLGDRPDFYNALRIKTNDLTRRTFANFTFDGKGATLLLDPTTTGIYINGCRRCVLENFTLRTMPSPMSEGKLVSATSSSADIRLENGQAFSVPSDYRPIIGKNARVAIFRVQDQQAFPTRFRFPARAPLVLMTSATSAAAGHVRIAFRDSSLAPALPPEHTVVSLIKPPLDAAKRAAMGEVVRTAAALRRKHPEYGPQFFTGNFVAALSAEQNDGLSIRNITISDFAGQGINAGSNRGPLVIDRVKIVPHSPGGLRSVGAAAIAARNNQLGPMITNSIIVNPGDDAIDLTNPASVAKRVLADTADLITPGALIRSSSVTAGDRFNVIDTVSGHNFGIYVVTSATPLVMGLQGYGYRVKFNVPLPAAITSASSESSATFVNLDQSNSGAVIHGNLIMGGERNGIIISSSGTVENNAFVGLGLWGIQYLPVAVRVKARAGVWSDFGPVKIADNIAIDNAAGFLRLAKSGTTRSYRVKIGGLRVTGNAVIAPAAEAAHYKAVVLSSAIPVPTAASGNILAIPAEKEVGAQFRYVGGRQGIAAWTDAFAVNPTNAPEELWRAKCQAIAKTPLWAAAIAAAAPTACR